MIIKKINKNNQSQLINLTLKLLNQGRLVIFPSDTVYGALVDATNEKAVRKLIEFKNRPPGKPISVFVSDFEMLKQQLIISNKNFSVLKQILPGPFTVVLRSKHNVSRLLESEKKTLGVRLIKYQLVLDLVKKFGKPITATSANLAGRSPHYSINSLLKSLPQKKQLLIDLIIDGGKLPRNKPSTVVDLTTSKIKILRKGSLNFLSTKKFISKSPEETKKIAGKLLEDFSKIKEPLVFIVQGDLGVGKTVFAKGLGEKLGINDIISPTFVVYYEYDIKDLRFKIYDSRFIHLDLYNIKENEEFEEIGIEKMLKPGNILCFEWGEKAGEIFNLLKNKAKIIYVKMKYLNEISREIIIHF